VPNIDMPIATITKAINNFSEISPIFTSF